MGSYFTLFVRSGWIELSNLSGTFRGVGQSGNAWLSRALSTNTGSTATPRACLKIIIL